MALQVWLPLTGDLKNLGLDDISVINNGAAVSTTGKIGSCYNGTSSSQTIVATVPDLASMLANGGKYSFACWVKMNATAANTNQWIVKLGTNTCGFWWGYDSPRFVWNENDNGKRVANGETTAWHHFVVVVDKTVSGRITTWNYMDGTPVSGRESYSWDSSSQAQPTGNTITIYPYMALVNDLRIYDHALSQKEIKLLSQGLVAHYPLNDGIGGDNLIINTWEMQSQAINGYALADYSFIEHLVSGQKYTITARIRMSEDKKSVLCYHSGGSYNMGGSWAARKGEDEIYSWTFTATDAMASQTSKLGYGYLRIYVSNNQGIQGSTPITGSAYCHWIKIEKGEKSTPWVPNKQDALYSALGLDDGIVHDCSGYGCNARMIGTPIIFNDPPRYSVCQSFTNDVNTRYIRDIYTLRGLTMNEVSVSIWFKTNTINDSLSGDGGNFYSFGYNNGLRVRIPKSNGAVIWIYSHSSAAQFTYSSSLADDKWHHLVIVFDNGLMLCYIDGSQIESAVTKSSTTITFADNEYYRIATAQNGSEHFIGSLSDLRIYATALSAEDVKNLYETTASIDDHNNIYAHELWEA